MHVILVGNQAKVLAWAGSQSSGYERTVCIEGMRSEGDLKKRKHSSRSVAEGVKHVLTLAGMQQVLGTWPHPEPAAMERSRTRSSHFPLPAAGKLRPLTGLLSKFSVLKPCE